MNEGCGLRQVGEKVQSTVIILQNGMRTVAVTAWLYW